MDTFELIRTVTKHISSFEHERENPVPVPQEYSAYENCLRKPESHLIPEHRQL